MRFRPLALCFFALVSATALAQPPIPVVPGDVIPHGPQILLWENGAPGAVGTDPQDKPHLEFFAASPDDRLKEDHLSTTVIVCPGGGYTSLAYDKEGTRIAEWLNLRGISAFVLTYRLAPRYRNPAPILDGERAVRWVRAHAKEYNVAPNRIGVWGFSAGGHLVGMLGTRFDAGNPNAADPIDRISDRPDFVISSYGGLTLQDGVAKPGAMSSLMGDNPTQALKDDLSPDKHVPKNAPPFFLYASMADQSVPVLSSVVFYEALRHAGVPAEMHIFEQGPHGAALGGRFRTLVVYPDLLMNWMRFHGWLADERTSLP